MSVFLIEDSLKAGEVHLSICGRNKVNTHQN